MFFGSKAYAAQEQLTALARPTASLVRLAMGVGLIILLFLSMNLAVFGVLRDFEVWPTLAKEMRDGSSPRAIWIMLGNFSVLLLALAVSLRIVHFRGLTSLCGPPRALWRDFRKVLVAVAILYTVIFLIPGTGVTAPQPNLSLVRWAGLLPLSLVLIGLQVATEELLFRGYLQSQLAARFNSALVWLVLPAVLFGALHYEPGRYGANAPVVALWAVIFALAAADLTARAGNLGPALALHLLNNIGAILITAIEGEWDALALFVFTIAPDNPDYMGGLLLLEGLLTLCAWLAARIAIRR